jgi:predicted amidohydrolase YtcJ
MSDVLDRVVTGNIITLADESPVVEAIGIKDGKIVALGTVEDIKSMASANTAILDLGDKTVLPGFIDTHVHAGFTGTSALSVNLDDAVSVQDVLDRLAARIKETPTGELVYATRFNYTSVAEHRMPNRAELEKLSVDHPIAIHCMDGHSVMLNSQCFRDLGLAPEEEGVVRDEHGNPTGLVEDPAIAKVFSLFASSDEPTLMPLLHTASNLALQVGITTIHMKESPEAMAVLLANEDSLPVRAKPFYLFSSENLDALDELVNSGQYKDRAIIGLIADGSPDSKTAAYFEPYPDDEKNFGVLFYSDEELTAMVGKAHRAGYQVSVHACGARCIEQVLNTYEQILKDNPREDHRHRIEHFETPSASQLQRAAKIGITASMHPQHANLSEGYAEYMQGIVGENMSERMLPLRSTLDAGMLLAGGSDSPVAPMAPLTSIHDCVNHPNPKHRISLYEALCMFTTDAARIGFEEEVKGSIQKGKLADLVVLSDNPYAVPRENIREISVEMTLVGGETRFPAE